MRADSSGPMPAIGSSSSTSRGRLASAMPTSSARRSPCDSWSIAWARLSVQPHLGQQRCERCSNSAVSARTGRHARKLLPETACSASAMLSSTVKLLNSRVIWNERTSPRRARWCVASAVMSWPSKMHAAAVAGAAGPPAAPPAWSCRRRWGRSAHGLRRRAPAGRRRRWPPGRRSACCRPRTSSRGAALMGAPSGAAAPAGRPARGARTAPRPAAPSRSRIPSAACRPTAAPAAAAAPRRRRSAAPERGHAAEDHHHHQRAGLRPVQQVGADVARAGSRSARRRCRRGRRPTTKTTSL